MTTEGQPTSPRARGRRGSYANSRRDAILEAAVEVFAASGFRAGSLREVGERVGMTDAGILHHFPSKKGLLVSVLARRDEHTWAGSVEPEEDPEAFFRRVVALARRNEQERGAVELFTTLAAEAIAPDHPAHEHFVSRYRSSRSLMLRGFTAAEERGLLRPGVRAAHAAKSTVAVWDGLQLQWLLDRESVDIPAELAAHLESLTTLTFDT